MTHTLSGMKIKEVNCLLREVKNGERVVQRKVSVQIEIPGCGFGHKSEPDTLRVSFPIWDTTVLAAKYLETQMADLLNTSPMYADALEKFYMKEQVERSLYCGMGVGREVNADLPKAAKRDVLENTALVIWQKTGAMAEGVLWVGDLRLELVFDEEPSEKHLASMVCGWARPVVPQRTKLARTAHFA